jgi:hypothetical protein
MLIFGESKSTDISRTILSGRDLSWSESSGECFNLITAWINRCLGNAEGAVKHDSCSIEPQNSFIPLRTIDVGPSDGSRQPFLAINSNQESSTFDNNDSYARGQEKSNPTGKFATDISRCRDHY